MRIVQLNRDLVGQGIEIRLILAIAIENILQRSAHEEILLLEPQFASHCRGIVRIEYLGQVFGFVLVLHRLDIIAFVEIPQFEIARGLRRP